jgi:ABC-2 type transport system ATP-binding protein
LIFFEFIASLCVYKINSNRFFDVIFQGDVMNITIEELSKEYGKGVRALNNVDLNIGDGVFGLLGPNGAGKTTLMRILATLMEPTDGRVKVGQLDLHENRREIRSMLGYLPQDFKLFAKLRTWEFLDYVASLAGLEEKKERRREVDRLLEEVGLFEARDRMARKLSGGMKRRLGIAQALIGHPRIVIVDEPTTGLDPEERIRFRNLLTELTRGEIIIVLSTHIVGDISSTCTDMALLDRGEVVFNDSPEKLVEMARGHAWCVNALDSELGGLKERYPVISTVPSSEGWEVNIVAGDERDFNGRQVEPNLEHAYMYFMEYVLDGGGLGTAGNGRVEA